MPLKLPDIERDERSLTTFFKEFYKHDPNTGNKVFPYANLLTKIAHRQSVQFKIDLDDVTEYDPELADNIKTNCYRYQVMASHIVDKLLPEFRQRDVEFRDNLDVYIKHRILLQQRNNENPNEPKDPSNMYPAELLRRFEVVFKHQMESEPVKIRQVNASTIGKLISVKGIVTRATAVKPLMQVATYTCTMCGSETYQPINSLSFTPREFCESRDCKTNKTNSRLHLQPRASKFIKFQEIKIQEHTDEVPVGRIPRSLTVYARGEVTRQAQPGDHVLVSGIFFPLAGASGFNKMNAGLKFNETYVEAHRIVQMNKSQNTEADDTEFTQEEMEILSSADLYDKLAVSLAPEIYGHEDIKKALLLLLVGGSDQQAKGSLKIRGNIHACLMGDPGVAKSQLLAFVDRLAPRSQYTTGRGSSGVGLTASVNKDPITNEFVLEGGALVLADRGICCIDEFDKMLEGDRTAIHEVMEQQTISIAKAGIMTSLNARVSILAAANPAFGRYNPAKSIEANVQLPAALLSRFDLLWLIQDIANRDNDRKLANHITHVHMHNKNPDLGFEPIPLNLMRKYLNAARDLTPTVPPELTEKLAAAYVMIRETSRNNKKSSTFTSARSLLSIIRLSTALAKLRLKDTVIKEDIDEALRLIEMSKDTLMGENNEESRKVRDQPVDKIYKIVVELMDKNPDNPVIMIDDVIHECGKSGFTNEQIYEAIDEYEGMNVWVVNGARTKLTRVY